MLLQIAPQNHENNSASHLGIRHNLCDALLSRRRPKRRRTFIAKELCAQQFVYDVDDATKTDIKCIAAKSYTKHETLWLVV